MEGVAQLVVSCSIHGWRSQMVAVSWCSSVICMNRRIEKGGLIAIENERGSKWRMSGSDVSNL